MRNIKEDRKDFIKRLKAFDRDQIIKLDNIIEEDDWCANDDGKIAIWEDISSKRRINLKDVGVDVSGIINNKFIFSFQWTLNFEVYGTEDDFDEIIIISKFDNANINFIKVIFEIYKKWFVENYATRQMNEYCIKVYKKYFNRRIDCRRINRKKTRCERKCIKGNEYNFNKRMK